MKKNIQIHLHCSLDPQGLAPIVSSLTIKSCMFLQNQLLAHQTGYHCHLQPRQLVVLSPVLIRLRKNLDSLELLYDLSCLCLHRQIPQGLGTQKAERCGFLFGELLRGAWKDFKA